MPEPFISVRVSRNLSEIGRVSSVLESLCQEQNVAEDARLDIQVCLEEGLTNVIRHSRPPESEDEIWVLASITPTEIEIRIEDNGSAFNPLSQPPPPLHLGLRERPAGGLGVHLIRTLMDRVEYERQPGCNCLTMTKKMLRPPGPRATDGVGNTSTSGTGQQRPPAVAPRNERRAADHGSGMSMLAGHRRDLDPD